MDNNHLSYYQSCFCSLNVNKQKGRLAPHKALLLLSVIDLVERGIIRDNRIELTETLERTFKANVKKFVGNSTLFRPNLGTPFYHMKGEPFWKLVPQGGDITPCSTSLKTLRTTYRYAVIDRELFNLLQNEDVRANLRVILISTYLIDQPNLASPLPMIALIAVVSPFIA